ncbi:tetratricopeptide repeat protein (plasmid) [Paroceanicella profunda]|uniref:Tetratricopeptide repeat protein n=1 Tax=Paroceanicella profunda TaxID=2579971 RepID=A0A5B8G4H4_9RHOB|nr:tetratricopeptide repeat-containing glycosyltransferase family protein [Paroceanicella profunda]QDL94202.1 tetratricopeptide repeat protein [Paroceanicella profunda]
MTTDLLPPGPKSLAGLREQAVADHRAGRLDSALAGYRAILARAPGDASMWSNLGALHRARREFTAALACQRRALELEPGRADIVNNLGNALYDEGLHEEALECRRTVARLSPGDASALQHVATSLRTMNRFTEAIAVCDEGLALAPGHAELRLQRAMARLAQGDYAGGFADFEARWDTGEITKSDPGLPEWRGEPLDGRTLLVFPEQGFGDTMLMARFLPQLKACGAGRVILVVKPPLQRLLEGIPGCDAVAVVGSRRPEADLWVPMMSLPLCLGLTPGTVPPPARLTVPDDAGARARALLAPHRGRLTVGVLWSGSLTYRANHKRSFAQERFYRLAGVPGVSLFSLYKGPLLEEFRGSPLASLVIDAGGHDRDFADTAGLIRALDLVVSMDSAVVHLAGSLGRPVWNLLHHSAYWLYGPEGATTPWYPSMRLIRQPVLDDWDSVFDTVVADLAALAAARGAARA